MILRILRYFATWINTPDEVWGFESIRLSWGVYYLRKLRFQERDSTPLYKNREQIL